MSGSLDTCGCFDKLPVRPQLWNRPGLPVIAYHAATHAGVLERLLARLDRPDAAHAAALEALRTRDGDDPVLGLLDAFAVVADVLGFYQERIANEGFLGTATERRSIHELARLLGYEPKPGVAASAWLAFSVEDRAGASDGSSQVATVRAGTRVQSIPSGTDLPQTFETSRELLAEAERNELRPRLTVPAELDTEAEHIYLAGVATALRPGDLVAIADEDGNAAALSVQRVVVDHERARTRVDFVPEPADVYTAPPPSAPPSGALHANATLVQSEVDGIAQNTYTDSAIQAILIINQWQPNKFKLSVATPPPPPEQGPAEPGVYALRTRASVFGHNAPRHGSALVDADWEMNWEGVDVTVSDSQASGPPSYMGAIDVDPPNARILPESWVALAGASGEPVLYRAAAVRQRSRADFAISAKVTHLALTNPGGEAATGLTDFHVRDTTVHAESERLELAEVPLDPIVAVDAGELTLDAFVLGMEPGQAVVFEGEDADLRGVRSSEVVALDEVTHLLGCTTLHFGTLEHSYARETLVINANVVAATHGESVGEEILGSGSGARGQRFTLARPPLTHVQSASASGALSTLAVRVDGVLWEPGAGLYGLGPSDERYVVQRDDDGRTSIVFGDGERGARLPSGTDNVRAEYRTGIGAAGMVAAGSLTLLQTRPPGVRSVVNPLAAAGAEDPEDRDSARANAPLTVLTMDRVVTVSDYTDFARGFAGIAKAVATEVWRDDRRIVHVTVAAPGGETVSDETVGNLRAALLAAGDPGVVVEVGSFQPLPFDAAGTALVDERYAVDAVVEAIRAELAARYGFAARALGSSIAGSELVAAAMAVAGVVDFRLTNLQPHGAAAAADPLHAHLARVQGDAIAPAELLTLAPAGANVTGGIR